MTELIGQRLGSYQLEALLAAGPTGNLYSGRHVRLGRQAAIKLFDPALVARPGVQPRLMAALRDIAALRHPQLAALFDVGDADGRLFLATELLPGGSLRALLQPAVRETVPLEVRLELVAQAAEGLAAAHAAGVVHGAVKPESLWLERRPGDGAPALKITDLGVSAALPEEALGAPAYLSPEQCRGQAIDGRADLYSLGVVLYELLVGAPPFNVRTVEAAVEKHLRTRPVPPRLVRPQIPPAVEAITLRCLAKTPDERYADGAALAAALRQAADAIAPAAAAALPIAVPPPPAPIPPPPTVRVDALPLSEQPTVRAAAPLAATPPPRVEILGPQGALLHVANLGAGMLTAGRAPDRDLFLDDPQISREHLTIGWDGRSATVTDLGSANGSFLGAARLLPNVPTAWDGLAPLRLGPFTLRLAPPPGLAAAGDPLLSGLLGDPTAVAAAQPAPPPRAGRIELRVDQERLTLTPGAPTLVPVIITNAGSAPEQVSLGLEGVPGAWLSESDQQVFSIAPGGQAVASLTVAPPRAPEALAGDYNVILRARPLGGGEPGVARLRWTVLPFRAAELRIAPARAESRDAADYQVLLRNLSNEAVTYFLTFEDEDELLGYALEQDEVLLDAGQTARVGLKVEAAGRLFGGPQERLFAVRADDGQHEAAVAEAQLVHHASLPAWVPLAGLGALLLALLLGGWAILGGGFGGGAATAPTVTLTPLPPTLTPFPTPLPGAPTIQQFLAEPQVVAPGEVVTLSWSVTGAERVFIDQFGDVPPLGQRQFRPEQTTDFRLTAIAPGGRETIVIARVNVAPPTPLPTLAPTVTPLPTLTPLPTVIPPTLAPPTAVPPTAVPPTVVPPTAVPPTVVPPTAVPPTAIPATAVPPIATLPALTPPAGNATVDLAALAPSATWTTGAGQVPFGAPAQAPEAGGWAALADATLEDGQAYQGLLQMVPPLTAAQPAGEAAVAAAPFVEGDFTLQALQRGQILVGAVGFAANATGQSVTLAILFDNQILYQGTKAPDGRLLPIFVDLSNYAGRAGTLTLRVSAAGGSPPGGLYWVRPRVDVPR